VSRKTIALTVDAPYTRARNPSNSAILTLADLPLALRNTYVFQFTLQQWTAGAWAKFVLPTGWSRKLVVRDPDDLTGAVLAFTDNSAFNSTADWSAVSPTDGLECAPLSLNTPELIAWLNAKKLASKVPRLVLEFSAINPAVPADDPLTVLEAEFFLLDSWNVTIQPPSPGAPAYITAADLAAALALLLNVPTGYRIAGDVTTGQVYLEELP
jgi:hypothetical protein